MRHGLLQKAKNAPHMGGWFPWSCREAGCWISVSEAHLGPSGEWRCLHLHKGRTFGSTGFEEPFDFL